MWTVQVGDDGKLTGAALFWVSFLVLLTFVLWIVAIVLLIKYWGELPSWVQIVSLLLLILFGPIGTIIAIVMILLLRDPSLKRVKVTEKTTPRATSSSSSRVQVKEN